MEILSAQWVAVYLGLLRHLFSEICQHFIRGRGGESAPRCVWKCVTQGDDALERRSKIVAPLADAMRFVDNDGFDVPMRSTRREHGVI